MSNGQGNQQGQEGQSRNKRGKGGGGGQPLALTIDDVVKYDSTDRTLKASVLASRGTKTAANVVVQFSVDGNPTGGLQTTNASGRAFLGPLGVAYQPGEHVVSVEAVGEIARSQGSFRVPRPGETTEDTPTLNVTGDPTQTDAGFDLNITVTAKRGTKPIENTPIEIKWRDGEEERSTNANGEASILITVPNPTKIKQQSLEVRFSMDEPRVSTTKVYPLEWKEPKPGEATVLEPTEVSPGVYLVRVAVEDIDKNPMKDVAVSVSGGKQLQTVMTNRLGLADFTLRCIKGEPITTFTVDVPSIRKVKELKLLGPKAKTYGQPKQEKRLPLDAPLWAHVKQGFLVGAGRVRLKDGGKS